MISSFSSQLCTRRRHPWVFPRVLSSLFHNHEQMNWRNVWSNAIFMARISIVALTEIKSLVKFFRNNFIFRVLLFVCFCFFFIAAAAYFFVVVGVGHRYFQESAYSQNSLSPWCPVNTILHKVIPIYTKNVTEPQEQKENPYYRSLPTRRISSILFLYWASTTLIHSCVVKD